MSRIPVAVVKVIVLLPEPYVKVPASIFKTPVTVGEPFPVAVDVPEFKQEIVAPELFNHKRPIALQIV